MNALWKTFLYLLILTQCSCDFLRPPKTSHSPKTSSSFKTSYPSKKMGMAPPKLFAGEVRLSQVKTFQGETELLASHLGLTTGSIKIEYPGPKKMLGFGVEIWKKGACVEPVRWSATRLDSSNAILSVAVQDLSEMISLPSQKISIVIEEGTGKTRISKRMEIPETNLEMSVVKTLGKTIRRKDDKEIAIWGIMYGKGTEGQILTESIEEMAAKVEAAVLIKIRLN